MRLAALALVIFGLLPGMAFAEKLSCKVINSAEDEVVGELAPDTGKVQNGQEETLTYYESDRRNKEETLFTAERKLTRLVLRMNVGGYSVSTVVDLNVQKSGALSASHGLYIRRLVCDWQ